MSSKGQLESLYFYLHESRNIRSASGERNTEDKHWHLSLGGIDHGYFYATVKPDQRRAGRAEGSNTYTCHDPMRSKGLEATMELGFLPGWLNKIR